MKERELSSQLVDAKCIAQQLSELLREDAIHRLNLYLEYAHDPNATKWTPDLHHRCELAQALCRKLDKLVSTSEKKDHKHHV